MGGWGSGRHWLSKKRTVEECLTLDVNKLVKVDLLGKPFAEVRWSREGKEIASVSFARRSDILTLYEPLAQDIPLVTTQLNFGGRRFWFLCPNCRRRVGRLHLPHGRSFFFCRRCYDLTYTSCQECHKFDRLFAGMGIHPSVGRRLFRRSWRRHIPIPKHSRWVLRLEPDNKQGRANLTLPCSSFSLIGKSNGRDVWNCNIRRLRSNGF